MKEGKDNISGFFGGFIQRHIDNNLKSLALYADEIKEQCAALGIDSSKYENLHAITKVEDIDSWVAFGNYMIGRVELGKIEGSDLGELFYNYGKMAQIPRHTYLKRAAENLGELVFRSEK